MVVPAPLVFGLTGLFHLVVVAMVVNVIYFPYRAWQHSEQKLVEEIVYDMVFMVLIYFALIYTLTAIIRADRTLRRTHDILKEKYGYNSYDEAYQKQLRYIFPVNLIKHMVENKLVIPYYSHDKDYKLLSMFQQILIDADDDVESGHNHHHGANGGCNHQTQKDSEREQLIPSKHDLL